jgi:hypothetical protein
MTPSPAPPLICRGFRVPRHGQSLDDCEDFAAVDPQGGRFAVADGASESWQGGLWARLLVEDFVRGPSSASGTWVEGLGSIQDRWAEAAPSREISSPPWWLEDRLRRGAFATFLGLELQLGEGSSWRWRALALGDSCLFQVRGGELLVSFPVTRADDFGNSPWLLGSRTPAHEPVHAEGEGRAGDRFWLMTDALGQWFLRGIESGARPWEELHPFLDGENIDGRFQEWVEERRRDRRLRDDDVTLIAVGL